MMSSVAILKDLESRGLVAELSTGIWLRSPRSKMDRGHGDLPTHYLALLSLAS